MSIIPNGSIIPSRAVGTPIESWISADGANGVPNSHPWVYIVASQHRTRLQLLGPAPFARANVSDRETPRTFVPYTRHHSVKISTAELLDG